MSDGGDDGAARVCPASDLRAAASMTGKFSSELRRFRWQLCASLPAGHRRPLRRSAHLNEEGPALQQAHCDEGETAYAAVSREAETTSTAAE